jgi:large subunit ribosomal protein L10
VAQLKELRRSLAGNASYAVVKNTLTKIAATEAGIEGLDDMLAGPSALAFVSGDPVEAAKGLRAFAKGNPALVIKGGVMEGKVLSAAEVSKLADLESREVLLSKMAGAMKASMSGAASLFAAPLSQTARLVEALRQKVEEQGPAATEAAPAAEADGTTAEAPAEADEKTAEAPAEASETTAEAPADADQG